MFGRPDAATDLMREALAYADALHDFAYHLTVNETEADDLVPETYGSPPGTERSGWASPRSLSPNDQHLKGRLEANPLWHSSRPWGKDAR